MQSTDILRRISEKPEEGESKPNVSRSASAAAARALGASERLTSPQPHRFWQSPPVHEEDALLVVDEKYEEFKLRGLLPPWKIMRENRKKSREGRFLSGATLRKTKDEKKKPKRSNTVADTEAAQAKRDGATFLTD